MRELPRPTSEGFVWAAFLLMLAYMAGGWRGIGIMSGFLAFTYLCAEAI